MFMSMQPSRRNHGGLGSMGMSSSSVGGASDTGYNVPGGVNTLPADLIPVNSNVLNSDTGNAVSALTPGDLANTTAASSANYDLTSGANSPANWVTTPGIGAGIATMFTNLFGPSRVNGQVQTGVAPTVTIAGMSLTPVALIAVAGLALYLLTRKK